jgi:hypothetical protein
MPRDSLQQPFIDLSFGAITHARLINGAIEVTTNLI